MKTSCAFYSRASCLGLPLARRSPHFTTKSLRDHIGASLVGPLLLLALLTSVQAQLSYSTTNGTVTIIGYTGPGGVVTIPSVLDGLPVTSIASSAFAGCTNLTNITLPGNLINIGKGAFIFCVGLTSVAIPDSVTLIGPGAFGRCTGLTSVSIGSGVTDIDDCECFYGWAFSGCLSLTNFTVAPLNSVYSSLDGVLLNKTQDFLIRYPGGKRGHYTMPNSVRSFDYGAFADCYDLTSLTLGSGIDTWPGFPDTLTNITVDPLNPSFSSIDGMVYNKDLDTLILCPRGKGGNCNVPNGVTNVGDEAFFRCANLMSLMFPESLTHIGYDAFDDCPGLNSVFFAGNAPGLADSNALALASTFTVYYLPGTTGWGSTLGGRPAVLWNPRIQLGDGSVGVRANGFGFNIVGTPDIPLVVEASGDLAGGTWVALETFRLTNGLVPFTDREWTNHPIRFYRIRSP